MRVWGKSSRDDGLAFWVIGTMHEGHGSMYDKPSARIALSLGHADQDFILISYRETLALKFFF